MVIDFADFTYSYCATWLVNHILRFYRAKLNIFLTKQFLDSWDTFKQKKFFQPTEYLKNKYEP